MQPETLVGVFLSTDVLVSMRLFSQSMLESANNRLPGKFVHSWSQDAAMATDIPKKPVFSCQASRDLYTGQS